MKKTLPFRSATTRNAWLSRYYTLPESESIPRNHFIFVATTFQND
ncbi:hypothetical protein ACQKLP_06645 [Chitinophaga sp. NPDC101104]